ncbi:dihydroorotate oxidase [Candidatus Kaiserbacteria bacterium]|nr:dihydroorotate oxidase [Candidatus Kaiserbacteria bacterium]
MIKDAFYDPTKSYYDNYNEGPFGAFADGEVLDTKTPKSYHFLGKEVNSLFGIPAGPLLNAKFVKAALDKGFDLPIYKTVRSGVHESHAYPNVLPVDVEGDLTLEMADNGLITKEDYTDPLSITNSFGVPSYKPEVWQEDFSQAINHAKNGQRVGLSFQGTKWPDATLEQYLEDWVLTARLAAETKPDFLEANLSCPNEGTTALLCFDVDRVKLIAERVKAEIGDTPLLLKISYFKDNELLEKLVKETGAMVDGYSTINTISSAVRKPDGEQALPGEGRLRSGVCGKSIKWAGLEMVERFVGLRKKHNLNFSVVGVGGVVGVEDYHKYIEAGADAVMSATGAMWNPYLAKEIKQSLN